MLRQTKCVRVRACVLLNTCRGGRGEQEVHADDEEILSVVWDRKGEGWVTEVNSGLRGENARQLCSYCFPTAHYLCCFNLGKSVSAASSLLLVNFPWAEAKQTIFLLLCVSSCSHASGAGHPEWQHKLNDCQRPGPHLPQRHHGEPRGKRKWELQARNCLILCLRGRPRNAHWRILGTFYEAA